MGEKTKKKKKIKKAKKKKKTERIPKMKSVDDYADNDEENALDVLVGRRIDSNGIDLFGEYAKETNIKKVKHVKKELVDENGSSRDFPAKHGLVKQLTPNNRACVCVDCKKTMYLNEWMYHCRWCSYDLCIDCYNGNE